MKIEIFQMEKCSYNTYMKTLDYRYKNDIKKNEAGYTATPCGWAGVIFEVTRQFGQEQ